MMIHSKLKLKQQLLLLIGISTLMIFFLHIYYYSKFYSLTEDKEYLHASRIIGQVEEKVGSFAQDIKDAALASSYNSVIHDYLGSEDPIHRLKLNKVVREIMTGIKSSNKNIQSIMLVDKEGSIIGASNQFDFLILKELEKKYYFDIKKPDSQFFGKIYNSSEMERPAYFYVQPIFSSLMDSNQFANLGTCIVVYKTDNLKVSDTKATPNSLLLVLDEDDHVVMSEESSMSGTLFDTSIFLQLGDDSKEHKIEYLNKQNHVQFKKIELLDWKIVSLIPVIEMTDELRSIRNIGFIIGIAMTVLIFIMALIFIRSVTIPFSRIIRFVNSIGDNDGKNRLKLSARNEVGILANEINNMLDKIDETKDKFIQANTSLYQMELAKKQAELSFLQSQINPHFLYNTLECIRSIGLSYKAMEIVEIATSMAKIFRYSIKEDHFVPIKNEVDCIKDYLRIMSIRFMDKYTEKIFMEEYVLKMKIPKMILQPIVENAIYHGLERKSGKGTITIIGEMTKENNIRFEISDNGKGINEEELHDLRQCLNITDMDQSHVAIRGLGLLNIHRRIRLAFGEPYGISIYSKENKGTRVILQIPCCEI